MAQEAIFAGLLFQILVEAEDGRKVASEKVASKNRQSP